MYMYVDDLSPTPEQVLVHPFQRVPHIAAAGQEKSQQFTLDTLLHSNNWRNAHAGANSIYVHINIIIYGISIHINIII